jgi:hypothetical protein
MSIALPRAFGVWYGTHSFFVLVTGMSRAVSVWGRTRFAGRENTKEREKLQKF